MLAIPPHLAFAESLDQCPLNNAVGHMSTLLNVTPSDCSRNDGDDFRRRLPQTSVAASTVILSLLGTRQTIVWNF
jgi:hypothetical protein